MFEALFALTALLGGASVVQGAKANRAARRAQESQHRMDNLRAARERRGALRDARIALAIAENNANIGGVAESSGAQGGQGSIITQGNSNVAFLDRQQALSDNAYAWSNKAAKLEASANMFAGLSKLTGAGMDYFGMTTPSPSGGTSTTTADQFAWSPPIGGSGRRTGFSGFGM